jgi:cohesin loading factor subunit SCC2
VDASVRHAALALVGSLLSSGLAHPARILPKLLALEVDTLSNGCAAAAKVELRAQFDRHKEMLSNPSILLEGALEAYRLHAAFQAREAGMAEGGPKPERRAHASFVYTLHTSSRKPRQAYLRALLGKLAPEQYEECGAEELLEELRRCEWFCHCLAEMPYEKESDVLTVVHQANRMLSLHADPRLSDAATLLCPEGATGAEDLDATSLEKMAAGTFAADAASRSALAGACHRAALIGLTLCLKQHLKRMYGLSDIRCQSFDPVEASKAPERPVSRNGDIELIDTAEMWCNTEAEAKRRGDAKKASAKSAVKAGAASVRANADGGSAGSTSNLAVAQYCWLRSLMAEDEGEFDYNLLSTKREDGDGDGAGKPPKPRRRASGGGATSNRAARGGGSAQKGAPSKASGKAKMSKKRKKRNEWEGDSSSDGEDEDDMDDEEDAFQ